MTQTETHLSTPPLTPLTYTSLLTWDRHRLANPVGTQACCGPGLNKAAAKKGGGFDTAGNVGIRYWVLNYVKVGNQTKTWHSRCMKLISKMMMVFGADWMHKVIKFYIFENFHKRVFKAS